LRDCSKEVRLLELLTHAALTNKLDDLSERELLEYALNTVHEQSVVVYLTRHYSHEVVTALTGDSLFLVDQSIPTQERIDAAVKRVQKMTSSAKAAITPSGAKGKGGGGCGEGGGKKKKWTGKQQPQQHQ
jgi:hypothetical protein